jgi:prepilin-type N-terminal cleavage/methylation domain-containing protein
VRRSQGFSLTELMVAISVAGLLMLLLMPRARNVLFRSNVHSARGSVVTMFQKAKIRAIQDARATTFNVDNATGVVWITAKPRRSAGAAACACDTVGSIQNLTQLYGVTVNATPMTSFTFDPHGIGVLRTGNDMKIGFTQSTFKDSVLISGFGEFSK